MLISTKSLNVADYTYGNNQLRESVSIDVQNGAYKIYQFTETAKTDDILDAEFIDANSVSVETGLKSSTEAWSLTHSQVKSNQIKNLIAGKPGAYFYISDNDLVMVDSNETQVVKFQPMFFHCPSSTWKGKDVISKLYSYQNFQTIENFLRKNLAIKDLLYEVYYKLLDYFDNDANLSLEVVSDPYEPQFEQLFIHIKTGYSVKESLNRLNNFENAWWFERTAYVINSPVITLE